MTRDRPYLPLPKDPDTLDLILHCRGLDPVRLKKIRRDVELGRFNDWDGTDPPRTPSQEMPT